MNDRFSILRTKAAVYTLFRRLLGELIREVNADHTVDLVLHAGDIKGSGPCDEQVYRVDLGKPTL